MNEATSQLSNREIALLIWLAVFFVGVIAYRPTRQSLGPFFKVVFFSKISIILVAMLAYVSLIALIFHWLRLAHWWMLKDALFWFFGTAIILAFNTNKATEEEHYFKKLVLDALTFAVVLDFIVNLYTFNLVVELVLMLFLAVVATLAAVAAIKDEFKPAKKPLNGVLVIVGFGLLIYSLAKIIADPASFATVKNLEDLLTPIVLTLALLPFLFGVVLYSAYEWLFAQVGFRIHDDKDLLAHTKRQIILVCRASPRRVHRFTKDFVYKLGGVEGRGEVQEVISEFKAARTSSENDSR